MKIRSSKWKIFVLGFALMEFQALAHAIDSFTLEGGVGKEAQIVRAGVQWNWDSRWFQSNGNHISGYWDVSAARWRGTRYKNTDGRHQYITSVGVTPVFRWQQDNLKGFYAEGGVGVNLLSELYDNDGSQLATRFEFGDHIGIGYVFDSKLDLGLKYLHYSNAGIKEPNDGADFILLRLRYSF
jgi:lipid A 3-O-deacylase